MPKRLILAAGLLGLLVQSGGAQTGVTVYVGKFSDDKDFVVYFEQTRFGLTMRPALWTATQLLKQAGTDDFIVVDRPQRGAKFIRNASGRVTGVQIRGMEGEGLNLTRATHRTLPIELLLAGNGRPAAQRYLAEVNDDPARLLDAAQRVLNRFPSKAASVVAFLSAAAPRWPRDARLQTLLGYAEVAAGDRVSALGSFRRAFTLDAKNKEAAAGLAMLGALPAELAPEDKPWDVAFPLASVFATPTLGEIRAVEAVWRTRDLKPGDVIEVANAHITFDGDEFNVRIVAHRVHGQRHYGAIISPVNSSSSALPVIVEAKGVSWNYFHLDLNHLDSPSFMGAAREEFIYVVPSFRGEVLEFDGASYESEGDRTNAWDGATDDAIALLNVALQTTPAADPKRICAFGRSRGGSVALLMGERDSRIRCVVEWSGPTDWFALMGTDGWTQQELFAEGLRTRAKPDETGGQLVEHFLLKAVHRQEDLAAVRQRMLAASPLYFGRHLPRVQVHYGMEDTSVPVRNGLQLARRLNFSRAAAPSASDPKLRKALSKSRAVIMRRGRSEAFFYPGQGHDTDRLLAPVLSRQFLIDALLGSALSTR